MEEEGRRVEEREGRGGDGGRGRRDWVSAERNGSTEEEQEKKTNLNR